MNETIKSCSKETEGINKNQMEILELKKYNNKNKQAHWKDAIAEWKLTKDRVR